MVTVKKKSNRQFCSMLRVETRTRGGLGGGRGVKEAKSREAMNTKC